MFRPSARSRLLVVLLGLSLSAVACSAERPSLGDDAAASREVVAEDSTATDVAAPTDRVVRLAVGADWTGDPADAGPATVSARVIAGLLFEGLTAIGPDGSPQPGLAERWFVSDDRLRWTFVLPSDLVDGAGTTLTARDVKASFERLAARGASDQSVAALSVIDGWDEFVAGESGGAAGIVALDATTLVIDVVHPYEPLALLLASPTYGVTGTTAGGDVRTTGAYRMTDDPSWLEAVAPDAAVPRVELVRSDGNGAALLTSRRVDWAVLEVGDGSDGVPGDVLRQPLDLRVGLAVRLEDQATRMAVLAAVDPAFLASAVPHGVVDVSAPPEARADALPATLVVHVPEGELEAVGREVVAQLTAAGVDASAVVLAPDDFAEAVASGEATVFPMISAGGAWAQSAGVAVAGPGAVDDVFGVASTARTDLLAAIWREPDPAARVSLVAALDRLMVEEGLLLPIARFEVRIGVGEDMDALRTRPDGTLDLDGLAS